MAPRTPIKTMHQWPVHRLAADDDAEPHLCTPCQHRCVDADPPSLTLRQWLPLLLIVLGCAGYGLGIVVLIRSASLLGLLH